ncbi:DedA family protein [Antricoccus suffuscus]|nr:VTT domain-containing protein [Antricoccus suffuscus]
MTYAAAAAVDSGAIGYPALVGGVLLGSLIPLVPTGALCGAAAAVAMTTPRLSIVLVIVLAAVAAFAGDVIVYALARLGSDPIKRWVARGHHIDRLSRIEHQFDTHGWQIIVIGRLLPAGRIPALIGAAALEYPWRRLLPAVGVACLMWSGLYSALGVVSGGIFDSPWEAVALVIVLTLLVTGIMQLIEKRRAKRDKASKGTNEPGSVVKS